jgi:hypothetical protein
MPLLAFMVDERLMQSIFHSINKPAICRLVCQGSITHISGLIYEETDGVVCHYSHSWSMRD